MYREDSARALEMPGAQTRALVGSAVASLSAAQLGVAALVATGLTNREAATRLYVSHHTIDFHLRQIFNKLGINSRVELARIVAEQQRDRQRDQEGTA